MDLPKTSKARSAAPADVDAEAGFTLSQIQAAGALVPEHVAIIMDGNHRWASERMLPGAAGHRAGAKRLRPVAEACAEMGVKTYRVRLQHRKLASPLGGGRSADGLNATSSKRKLTTARARREARHWRSPTVRAGYSANDAGGSETAQNSD